MTCIGVIPALFGTYDYVALNEKWKYKALTFGSLSVAILCYVHLSFLCSDLVNDYSVPNYVGGKAIRNDRLPTEAFAGAWGEILPFPINSTHSLVNYTLIWINPEVRYWLIFFLLQ
jgi:hypothetical protein